MSESNYDLEEQDGPIDFTSGGYSAEDVGKILCDVMISRPGEMLIISDDEILPALRAALFS